MTMLGRTCEVQIINRRHVVGPRRPDCTIYAMQIVRDEGSTDLSATHATNSTNSTVEVHCLSFVSETPNLWRIFILLTVCLLRQKLIYPLFMG